MADPARDFRLLVELAQPDNPPQGTLTLQRCQRGSHTKIVGLASLCLPPLPPQQQQQQQQQQAGQPSEGHSTSDGTANAAGDGVLSAKPETDSEAQKSETHGKEGGLLGMIKSAFTPKKPQTAKSGKQAGGKANANPRVQAKELVLVVDCSGSMSGEYYCVKIAKTFEIFLPMACVRAATRRRG